MFICAKQVEAATYAAYKAGGKERAAADAVFHNSPTEDNRNALIRCIKASDKLHREDVWARGYLDFTDQHAKESERLYSRLLLARN